MLGLASETGAILNVYKKYLRDDIGLIANREFLREELGDLLWYLAAVATACDLDLEEIAVANLAATPLGGQNHPTQGTSTAPRRDGERKYTVAQIAEFGVARPTIYRHLAEAAV